MKHITMTIVWLVCIVVCALADEPVVPAEGIVHITPPQALSCLAGLCLPAAAYRHSTFPPTPVHTRQAPYSSVTFNSGG